MRGPECAQRVAENLFRRRAGAARDPDDLGVGPRPAGAREVLERALRMRDGQKRTIVRELLRPVRDERAGGFRLERRAHEVMTVTIVALQRHEHVAGLQGPRVDRQTPRIEDVRCTPERRLLHLGRSPERAHVVRSTAWPPSDSAAATACSRSENGWVTPWIIWPVSWPLPAMT